MVATDFMEDSSCRCPRGRVGPWEVVTELGLMVEPMQRSNLIDYQNISPVCIIRVGTRPLTSHSLDCTSMNRMGLAQLVGCSRMLL